MQINSPFVFVAQLTVEQEASFKVMHQLTCTYVPSLEN